MFNSIKLDYTRLSQREHMLKAMVYSRRPDTRSFSRLAALGLLLTALLASVAGCRTSSKVAVPPVLSPMVEADTSRLIEEINRQAAVRSLRGKVDVQFLDTSFAKCGVAEKYRTADGTVTVQRPGQIWLVIQVPFINTDVAQMTSDGERFRVAVLQGEAKYKRFVRGTNMGDYTKLDTNGDDPDCSGGDKQTMSKRAVSALSSLRPQHITDALMVLPVAQTGSPFIYAQSESFEEEADTRPRAKKGARVVRPYYTLVELAPDGANRARVVRRFWFDRVGEIRLARVQTYDERGRLTTDVLYKEPRGFGAEGRYTLPSQIEVTRPQDRYSLRIAYQAPDAVKIDQPYDRELFDLKNSWSLPEFDLDAKERK